MFTLEDKTKYEYELYMNMNKYELLYTQDVQQTGILILTDPQCNMQEVEN